MNSFYAGLDVSTQSCKLVIIDLIQQTQVHLDSVNYDRDLPQYHTLNGVRQDAGFGVSESDPHMWLDAIDILFTRLQAKGQMISQIRAISVSGQQHGLVTITKEGMLSRPYSKLWNDFSTGEECDLLTQAVGGVDNMIKLVGNSQRTGYTAAKIFHMVRHEPENWKNTATIFLVHNYINWVLTGGKNGGVACMEQGDVSGSAIWNPVTRSWAEDVITAISLDLKSKLPPIHPPRDLISKIGQNYVSKYGFSPDCQIAAGSWDNMMGAIGTGNFKEGIVTVSLGTSGTAYTYMTHPYVDPKGEIAAFCDATGYWMPLLCISNLANGYEAILREYSLSHEQFEAELLKTPPGNGGKLMCPWFDGERTPDLPEASPVYFGFELDDFTQSNLCRAVMEGHIMNLYEGFIKLPVKPSEIRLTGGISKSKSWRQAIADIFECNVVPVLGEGAALGAAIHAAWANEKDKALVDLASPFILLDQSQRVSPIQTNVTLYRQFKPIYLAVSARIRGNLAENPFKLLKMMRK